MYIERTPLRISLIGGGLDFPEIYSRHEICTLGFTIDKYVYAIVNQLVPCFDYKFRVGYKEQDYGQSIDEIRHPIVREALRFFEIDEYLDIQSLSNIPSIAGLGSSSAFTIALFRCLNKITNIKLNDQEILSKCIEIERQTNGYRGGVQDQYHTFNEGFNLVNYSCNSILPISNELSKSVIENSMLLLDEVTIDTSVELRGVSGNWYSDNEVEHLLEINASIVRDLNGDKLTFNKLHHYFELSCKHKLNKMILTNKYHGSLITSWLIENKIFSWKYCGAPGSRAIYILTNSENILKIKSIINKTRSAIEIPIKFSE